MTRSCHGLFDQSPGLRDRVITDEAVQISLYIEKTFVLLYIAKTTFVFPKTYLTCLKLTSLTLKLSHGAPLDHFQPYSLILRASYKTILTNIPSCDNKIAAL